MSKNKNLKILPHNQIINVPPSLARCPKCGGKLYVELESWTRDYEGSWKAVEAEVHTECENEPDITDPGYSEWLDWHYNMPYVDWLPVDQRVAEWIDDNFRFSGL